MVEQKTKRFKDKAQKKRELAIEVEMDWLKDVIEMDDYIKKKPLKKRIIIAEALRRVADLVEEKSK